MTTSEAAAGPSPATSKALQKSADTVAAAVFRGDTGEAAQLHEVRAITLHPAHYGGWRLAGGGGDGGGEQEPRGDTNIVMPLRAGRVKRQCGGTRGGGRWSVLWSCWTPWLGRRVPCMSTRRLTP